MKCYRCDWPYAYLDLEDGEISQNGNDWIPGVFNCKNCDLELSVGDYAKEKVKHEKA